MIQSKIKLSQLNQKTLEEGMLIVSVVLYLVLTLVFTLRFFGLITVSKFITSFFLCVISVNILCVELLHFFHKVNDPTWFLILQVMITGVAVLILLDPMGRVFKQRLEQPRITVARPAAMDVVLLILLTSILTGVLYVGTLIPINNSDSLHTHLPRIYYWLQHGSLQNWHTPTVTQIAYPIILPIQGLWLFLLGRSELLFVLIPWFSLVTALALIYEIAILLGAQTRGALLACLVSLSFPVVVLQSFSYQGDLFIAPVVLSSVFFLLSYLKDNNKTFVYLSALPLSLAIGAKQTALLFLPVYGLALTWMLVKKRISWRTLWLVLVTFTLTFSLLSSFKFIQNLNSDKETQGSMFGSLDLSDSSAEENRMPLLGYTTNAFRYFYQGLSVDGLTGVLKLNAIDAKADLFSMVTAQLGLDLESPDFTPLGENTFLVLAATPPLNEDAAWYGPLFGIIFLIVVIFALTGKDKQRKTYLTFALLLLAVFFFSLVLFKGGWGMNRGRYLVAPVLAFTPLTFVIVPRQKIFRGIITTLMAASSVFLAFSTLLMNDSRPLWTTGTLEGFQSNVISKIEVTNLFTSQYRKLLEIVSDDLKLTAPDRQAISANSYYGNLFFQSAKDRRNMEFLSSVLQDNQDLYLLTRKTLLEYALFGVNRTRSLFPVQSLEGLPVGAVVVVENELLQRPPISYEEVAHNEKYTILIKR